jgi:hypothetical protein
MKKSIFVIIMIIIIGLIVLFFPKSSGGGEVCTGCENMECKCFGFQI